MADRFNDRHRRWRRWNEEEDRFERQGNYNRQRGFDRDFDLRRRRDYKDRDFERDRGWGGSREFEGRDYTRGTENRNFYDPDFERGRQDRDFYNRGFNPEREYPGGYYDRDFDRDFYDRDYEYNVRGFYDRDLDRGYTSGFYDQDFTEPGRVYTETRIVSGPFEGIGPRGYQRSDDRICEEVCQRLTQHGQLDASDIEVEVDNGEVILRGNVDSRRAKRMAEDAIETIPDVQDIHNELRVTNSNLMRGAGRKDVANIQAEGIDRQNWQPAKTERSGEAPGE